MPRRGLFSENVAVSVRPSEKNCTELIVITAGPISIIFFFNDCLSNGKKSGFLFSKKIFLRVRKKIVGAKKNQNIFGQPFRFPTWGTLKFENWSTIAIVMA